MTQVNLLPKEVRTRERVRRYTVVATGAVAAAVVLLLLVFVLQSARLSSAERALAAQRAVNGSLQGRITALQPFQDLHDEVAGRERMVDGLMNGRVLWSAVLRQVSASLPGSLWITSLNGSLSQTSPGTSPATAATAGGIVAAIQFQGKSFDHPTVAAWLDKLERTDGWVNAWVSSASRQQGGPTARPLVDFSVTVDLTTAASIDRRKP